MTSSLQNILPVSKMKSKNSTGSRKPWMPIAELNPLTQKMSVRALNHIYVVFDLKLTFYTNSTAKNADSLLLRLPQELKTPIYELVLGGQLIHIYLLDKNLKFAYHLCQAHISERRAQEIFTISNEPWFSEETSDRHNACYNVTMIQEISFQCPVQSDVTSEIHAGLNLALLRCCRQIYQEARLTTFSANTWSFSRASDLEMVFDHGLNLRFLAETNFPIRRLHLDVIIRFKNDEEYWNQAFRKIVEHLKILQHFYVNIDHQPWDDATLKLLKFKKPARNLFMKDLLKLKTLPLKTVTVTVCDYHILHSGPTTTKRVMEVRWTMAQKQEWAGYVRRVLLRQEDQEPASEEAT